MNTTMTQKLIGTNKPVKKPKNPEKQSKYLVGDPFRKVARTVAIAAAKSAKKLEEVKTQAKVLKLVKQGHTFEDVGEKLGVSPKEALDYTRRAIEKWCGELSLDAKEARELDLKRIDALMVILWQQIEPKELLDRYGRQILDPETLEPKMGPPDYAAVTVYKQLLERRAKMLGLDAEEAAVKINQQINVIERRYVGADPDVL